MKTHLTHDGIAWRPLFSRQDRLVRFDEITNLQGDMAVRRAGGRVRVPAGSASQLEAILAGPAPAASLAQASEQWNAFLEGPHGPRVAAQRLLETAERLFATDVHIEPARDAASIRFRLDGALVPFCSAPIAAAQRIAAALKGLAGCLPYRADIVQQGRIPRDGIAADVRASFVPTALGERVALRLFGRLRRLDDLGMAADVLAAFRGELDHQDGLLLVAGATGAGKTTTLYAALDHLARTRRGAHVSLEDPVEQRLRVAGIAVDQIELDPARGFDGEAALAAILRQDVDVVCLAEVRTPAEARLALHAAHTGRLVLAGVHAGTPEQARTRMLDLGAERSVLDTTLRAVLHQALVVGETADGGRVRTLQASLLPFAARARDARDVAA